MKRVIGGFFGEHRFLSNFHPSPVRLDTEDYASVEHAYQAAKFPDDKEKALFRDPKLTPGQAKRLAKRLKAKGLQPSGWESMSLGVMLALLRQKFGSGPLRDSLLATGDAAAVLERMGRT